jgi:hypothetical protein
MKILFLDIDGPLIPGRAYTMPGQTKPIVMKFDPCAVGLINNWCETRKWKLVIHSSWLRVFGAKETLANCVKEGIKAEHFHEDATCEENLERYTRVSKWLKDHPDTSHYMILDDEPYRSYISEDYPHPLDMKDHLIIVNFENGIISQTMDKLNGQNSKVKS